MELLRMSPVFTARFTAGLTLFIQFGLLLLVKAVQYLEFKVTKFPIEWMVAVRHPVDPLVIIQEEG